MKIEFKSNVLFLSITLMSTYIIKQLLKILAGNIIIYLLTLKITYWLWLCLSQYVIIQVNKYPYSPPNNCIVFLFLCCLLVPGHLQYNSGRCDLLVGSQLVSLLVCAVQNCIWWIITSCMFPYYGWVIQSKSLSSSISTCVNNCYCP